MEYEFDYADEEERRLIIDEILDEAIRGYDSSEGLVADYSLDELEEAYEIACSAYEDAGGEYRDWWDRAVDMIDRAIDYKERGRRR